MLSVPQVNSRLLLGSLHGMVSSDIELSKNLYHMLKVVMPQHWSEH